MIPHVTTFSPDRKYRYTLWRDWEGDLLVDRPVEKEGFCMFIGLNPSTADETQNDPTIRRCMRFAHRWGYRSLCMTNIFAYRATDPRDMFAQLDPIGIGNDSCLIQCANEAAIIIAAWGAHGNYLNRGREVVRLLTCSKLHCLSKTKVGFPGHPLYLRADSQPMPYP